MKGKFIVIEGGEGSGKGMCIDYLKEMLGDRDDIVFTREPGGTPVAEAIRSLVLSKEHGDMHPLTEIFLFCAARAEHVRKLIIPALKSGKHVICDRFYFSTIAYQIDGNKQSKFLERTMMLNSIAKSSKLLVDDVIFLDVTPQVGLERKSSSEDGICTRFDEQEIDYHRRVRSSFLAQSAICGCNDPLWHIVHTEKMDAEGVKKEVLSIVKDIIKI